MPNVILPEIIFYNKVWNIHFLIKSLETRFSLCRTSLVATGTEAFALFSCRVQCMLIYSLVSRLLAQSQIDGGQAAYERSASVLLQLFKQNSDSSRTEQCIWQLELLFGATFSFVLFRLCQLHAVRKMPGRKSPGCKIRKCG